MYSKTKNYLMCILVCTILNVYKTFGQDTMVLQNIEIQSEFQEVLSKKYQEGFSLIKLDPRFLRSYLESKAEGGQLTLQDERGKSITFEFRKIDNRTDDYVQFMPTLEGSYRVIPKADLVSYTYEGRTEKEEVFNMSIYLGDYVSQIYIVTKNGTEVIEPLEGDGDIFVWGKPNPKGEGPPNPPVGEKCSQNIVTEGSSTSTKKVCPNNAITTDGKAVINRSENEKRTVETNIQLFCDKCIVGSKDFDDEYKKRLDDANSLVLAVNTIYSGQSGLNVKGAKHWINYNGEFTPNIPNCFRADYHYIQDVLPGGVGGHTSSSMCKNVPAVASGYAEPTIISHELAHTMGVLHDCCCGGLMATGACDKFLVPTDEFTHKSLEELNNAIPKYGCLLSDSGNNTNTSTGSWISGPTALCKSGGTGTYAISLPIGWRAVKDYSSGKSKYVISTSSGLGIIERKEFQGGDESGIYLIKAGKIQGKQTITIKIFSECDDGKGQVMDYIKEVWVGQPIDKPVIKVKAEYKGNQNPHNPWKITVYVDKMPEGATHLDYTLKRYSTTKTGTIAGAVSGTVLWTFVFNKNPCLTGEAEAYSSVDKKCSVAAVGTIENLNYNCTSVSDLQSNNSGTIKVFDVFPNPVSDKLNIGWQTPSDKKENFVTVSMSDIYGRIITSKIYDKKENKQFLETQYLTNGIYFVNFKCGDIEEIRKININH